MASNLSDIGCTRCLEVIGYLVNPRLLSCGHVYCEICFDTVCKKTAKGVEIQCSHCGKEQQFADFGCLTAPTEVQMHDVTGGTEAATPAPPPCGKCKEKDTEMAAVCYCEQCEELFCNGDEQEHKRWCRNHKTISISAYQKIPNRYITPKCTDHQRELSMACEHCLKLGCLNCSFQDKICQDEHRHLVKSLKDMEKSLKADFAKIHDACTIKLDKMTQAEKETWIILDNIETNCETMKHQVERQAEEKVAQIRKEAANMIETIQKCTDDSRCDFERFLGDLRTERESLESLMKSNRQFLRESHVTDIINQKEERIQSLEKTEPSKLRAYTGGRNFTLSEADISKESLLAFEMAKAPTTVEYTMSYNIKGKCIGISYLSNYCFVVAYAGAGLTAFEIDFNSRNFSYYDNLRERYKNTSEMGCSARIVTSLDSHSNRIFCVGQHQNKEETRVVCQQDLSYKSGPQLFNFSCKSEAASCLSSSTRFICVSNPDENSIILYNNLTRTQTTNKMKYLPNACRFLQDTNVLLFSGELGVECYSISELGKLSTLWVCDKVRHPHGLAVLQDGNIIVHSPRLKSLYVISKFGALIAVFENEEISKASGGDICVREADTGGKFVYLPSSDQKSIIQFRIIY